MLESIIWGTEWTCFGGLFHVVLHTTTTRIQWADSWGCGRTGWWRSDRMLQCACSAWVPHNATRIQVHNGRLYGVLCVCAWVFGHPAHCRCKERNKSRLPSTLYNSCDIQPLCEFDLYTHHHIHNAYNARYNIAFYRKYRETQFVYFEALNSMMGFWFFHRVSSQPMGSTSSMWRQRAFDNDNSGRAIHHQPYRGGVHWTPWWRGFVGSFSSNTIMSKSIFKRGHPIIPDAEFEWYNKFYVWVLLLFRWSIAHPCTSTSHLSLWYENRFLFRIRAFYHFCCCCFE